MSRSSFFVAKVNYQYLIHFSSNICNVIYPEQLYCWGPCMQDNNTLVMKMRQVFFYQHLNLSRYMLVEGMLIDLLSFFKFFFYQRLYTLAYSATESEAMHPSYDLGSRYFGPLLNTFRRDVFLIKLRSPLMT